MIELLNRLAENEMFTESRLPGVRFFKSSSHISRTPLVYDPGIFIVAQGRKIGYLGERFFQYDADNYLVASVHMPFECETFASPNGPFLGIYIDIDMDVLQELINTLAKENPFEKILKTGMPNGIGPAIIDDEMRDAVIRLLKCLGSNEEARMLGPALKKEILYRALNGTQAASLYAMVSLEGEFARIAHALGTIHSNYTEKLSIEELSRVENMSVSTFHRVFKEITSDTPVQYIKKIRLNKALDLIRNEGLNTTTAADAVGYVSCSQFCREFKRHFGDSPGSYL